MSEFTQAIKQDIDLFQIYVQKMSTKIQSASVQWNDEQYSALSKGIYIIARQSKDVLVKGDKFCESADKFFEIANENYE